MGERNKERKDKVIKKGGGKNNNKFNRAGSLNHH